MDFNTPRRFFRRVAVWLLIALIVLLVGLMVGFGLAGGNPFGIFVPQTWIHLFDFLK